MSVETNRKADDIDSSNILRSSLKRPDLFRESAYVGGIWTGQGRSLDVFNPATGVQIGAMADGGGLVTEQAVVAATTAFPHWSRRTAGERAALLRAWGDAMLLHRDDLAIILTLEQGKPLAEAKNEIAYAASYFHWFAEEARRAYGDIIPGHGQDKRLMVLREPVGVVAAITPWNFPSAMITRKVGAALAAGCTIIVKPSELTPFSALALSVLAEDIGLPPGVFNVVTGMPGPIGDILLDHQDIAKFSFTGSTGMGKALAARAMATVKRVSLELGGNAPFLVFDDANVEQAVAGAIASKFRNAGQTCVCTNRFLVQSGIHDAFVSRLRQAIADLRTGDGLSDGVTMGPLINEAAVAKVERHVKDALERGGTLLAGGSRQAGPGHFFPPTLIDNVPDDALLCEEETFGPLAAIVRFDTERQAIGLANAGRAGLAAYLFTGDLSRSIRVSEALRYGMVGLNTGMISTETAPFGGIRDSGFGREGSRYGLDDYLNMKLICTAVSEC